LIIVLGMMFIETWLVYPIPPLSWGNWHPTTFQFEDVNFTSADGTKLHGWYVAHPNPVSAILYCHGNGEDVAADGQFIADLSKSLQASVFVFDYRGYGNSEGSPNEAGCIAEPLRNGLRIRCKSTSPASSSGDDLSAAAWQLRSRLKMARERWS
jgi:uncharacterized protein